MDFKDCYNGRTAVITGAGSGMGLLASQELAKAGANVVMCDINAEAVDGFAKEIREAGGKATAVVADVRKFADAERAAETAVATYGSLDLLLCIAGGNEARCCGTRGIPFWEQPVESIDWGIDVNLRGPVYFARACMSYMVAAKKGVICLIGSVMGIEADRIGAMYGAAKSGLFNFVKSLAFAGGEHGIRAVCVSPGPDLTRPGMATKNTALGRAAQPDELVDVILYLSSDDASFVTGTNILVDGGRMCLPGPYAQ